MLCASQGWGAWQAPAGGGGVVGGGGVSTASAELLQAAAVVLVVGAGQAGSSCKHLQFCRRWQGAKR